MKYSEYAVTAYISTAFSGTDVAEDNMAVMIRFLKCTIFGMFLDWLAAGLPEDAVGNIRSMLTVSHGLSDEIIKRCREVK